MTLLPDWTAPAKPAEITYERLIEAILDRTFPANSTLPAERQLADRMGVTRSTLREALQRLASEGWIDIQQGKPTRIRDIWTEGNLTILAALVNHETLLPPSFVLHLLSVREALAPIYTAEAVLHNASAVEKFLSDLLRDLIDSPDAYAAADWNLHHRLTVLSTNPVYTLILNGFAGFYEQMALLYFSRAESRSTSHQFYEELRRAAAADDPARARTITLTIMRHSIDLWRKLP
jgi:GntR family transcriptional regulator, negative regulator for fad regulon and positive regulator of fabA